MRQNMQKEEALKRADKMMNQKKHHQLRVETITQKDKKYNDIFNKISDPDLFKAHRNELFNDETQKLIINLNIEMKKQLRHNDET